LIATKLDSATKVSVGFEPTHAITRLAVFKTAPFYPDLGNSPLSLAMTVASETL